MRATVFDFVFRLPNYIVKSYLCEATFHSKQRRLLDAAMAERLSSQQPVAYDDLRKLMMRAACFLTQEQYRAKTRDHPANAPRAGTIWFVFIRPFPFLTCCVSAVPPPLTRVIIPSDISTGTSAIPTAVTPLVSRSSGARTGNRSSGSSVVTGNAAHVDEVASRKRTASVMDSA